MKTYLFSLVFILSVITIYCVKRPKFCQSDPDSGMCEALIPRYYFDKTTKSCLQFNYGGCGGNKNNFETLDDCRKTCKPSNTNICSLPPETGPCLALFRRFYWNNVKQDCVEFTYGGCDGNENNFETKEACLQRCCSC